MKYSKILSAAALFEKYAMEVCPRCGYEEKPSQDKEINLLSIISKLVDKQTKLGTVPDLVRQFVSAGLPLTLAKKKVLDLHHQGVIELRPYSGFNLTEEMKELSIPGPRGSTLSVFRLI